MQSWRLDEYEVAGEKRGGGEIKSGKLRELLRRIIAVIKMLLKRNKKHRIADRKGTFVECPAVEEQLLKD